MENQLQASNCGGTCHNRGDEGICRAGGDENPPDIVISLDRRDKGWRLFRYDGTPVDFSLISDRPEIAFTHKSGFMAKTKERLAIDDLIALVSKAVVGY